MRFVYTLCAWFVDRGKVISRARQERKCPNRETRLDASKAVSVTIRVVLY